MTATDSPAASPELEAAVSMLAGKMTELMAITAGLSLNHVLHAGSVTIPSDGFVTFSWRVPMAHVAFLTGTATAEVTASAAPPADPAPTDGIGVVIVPAVSWVSVPMVGPTLTIYGTAGDVVWVGAWSRPLPPSAA